MFTAIGGLAAVFMLAAPAPASAQASAEFSAARVYPWCARYSGGARNCGFVSYSQCRATVRGIGGRCVRNPRHAQFRDRGRYVERPGFYVAPGFGVFAGPRDRHPYRDRRHWR
jgi:hypothetical protein